MGCFFLLALFFDLLMARGGWLVASMLIGFFFFAIETPRMSIQSHCTPPTQYLLPLHTLCFLHAKAVQLYVQYNNRCREDYNCAPSSHTHTAHFPHGQ